MMDFGHPLKYSVENLRTKRLRGLTGPTLAKMLRSQELCNFYEVIYAVSRQRYKALQSYPLC